MIDTQKKQEIFNQLSLVVQSEVARLRKIAPIDTGNLSRFGIRMNIYRDHIAVYVDTRIAPYMLYTNEPWNNFAPPLYGNQNPNERWWNNGIEKMIYNIAKRMGKR